MRKNLKKLGSIAFGKIPPRKVMPNIVRSIVYFILFVFLAFLEYKTEKLILWSKLFHILALLVLFVIELRAIYSYYLLITKLSAWIVDCWFKIKWSFLYPTVNDWLIVTNIENAKGARVLDLLNERGILKNTSKLYNSIKTTNKLNGFEVYSCLRRDISTLDKESILDMQFYLKNSPKTVFYEIMKMLKNAVAFLTPILIMILAYLSNSNIELSNLNIKITLPAKSTTTVMKRITMFFNNNQYIKLGIFFGFIIISLIFIAEFLAIRRENRIERMLKNIIEESLKEDR